MYKIPIVKYVNLSIWVYFALLLVVSIIFMDHAMDLQWMFFGAFEILFFLIGIKVLCQWWWYVRNEKVFERSVFKVALFLRLFYVVFSYFLYIYFTGVPFEFDAGDATFYHSFGQDIARFGLDKSFDLAKEYEIQISDMGHPIYLGLIYSILGDEIIIPRLINAVWGAYTCVLIYRLAKRNFGEIPGRYAAIIAVLFHNFIYYTGLHLKEISMLFLTVLFLERADEALRGEKLSFSSLWMPIVVGLTMFFFRTVLGAVAFIALFGSILFSSERVLSMGKRILVGFLLFFSSFMLVSDKIVAEVSAHWEAREKNQSTSMEWRSDREGGNKFAKYGSASLFAPAVLVIPFPTMVDIDTQMNHQFRNGGYLEKQLLAFFVYIALWMLFVKYKTWRSHLLLLLFMGGYMAVVCLSAFAMSERFYLPAMPAYVIFVAFGISQMNKTYDKLYLPYLCLICVAVVAWNWFKLSGRGLI